MPSDIKKQIHETIEEMRLEILSQVKKEMTSLINELLSIVREDMNKKSTGAWENDRNLE